LLGDQKVELAPVPRVRGALVVRLQVWSLLGDVTVCSAA
jgi:hypothetical protein